MKEKKPNRRDFLKALAWGAGTVAVGTVIMWPYKKEQNTDKEPPKSDKELEEKGKNDKEIAMLVNQAEERLLEIELGERKLTECMRATIARDYESVRRKYKSAKGAISLACKEYTEEYMERAENYLV